MHIVLQYLSQHLEELIGWLVTILAALLSSDLLYRRSHRYQTRKLQKEANQRLRKAEHLLQQYAQHFLPVSDLFQIHMLSMSHPLKFESIYVPLHVFPENTLKYTLDVRMRKAEEMHDPEMYLQAELDLIEEDVCGAIDPADALRTYKHVVLVGGAGAGKTTLLRHLALQSARKQLVSLPALSLYVELSAFDPNKHNELIDLLVAQLGTLVRLTDTEAMKDLLSSKMHEGKLLLLLDGLDETRIGVDQAEARRAYSMIVGEIRRLASLYPSMPIMVAVRKASYQQSLKLKGFSEVEVAGFRLEDSQMFVKNWFQAAEAAKREEKIQDLQTRLKESLRLRILTSNPLLLTLAAIVYEKHLELPENRAEFYRQCVDVLQSQWDATRDIKRANDLTSTTQMRLLQEVAWHFHNQGRALFPLEELLQIVSTFLPTVDTAPDQAKQILEQMAGAHGLLREQASGIYGFSHLTFQEYFAAKYLVMYGSDTDLLARLDNPWWEEVVLLSASMHDASSLLQTLLGYHLEIFVPDDRFYAHLFLAGRCLAEKPQIRDLSLRDDIVNRLFVLLQETPYALIREQAATTLALIGGPRVNSLCLALLRSHDSQLQTVREYIGEALGTSGERLLAHELVELLADEDLERPICMVIARVLGQLGDPYMVDVLLHILQMRQKDAYVRQYITLNLAELGGDETAEKLLRLFEQEEVLVQRSIIIALGILGNREVTLKLLEILSDDTFDWQVRAAAAKALGMLGHAEAIPTMVQVLENDSVEIYVRQRIAAALGVLHPTESAIHSLLHLLDRDELDAEVRCSIAMTLGIAEAKSIVPELLKLLQRKQTNPKVGSYIILALGYIGERSSQVIEALKEQCFTQQVDYEMRCAAITAQGMLGSQAVISELLQLLENSQVTPDMLLHVIHALRCLSNHQGVDRQEMASQLVRLLLIENIDRYTKGNVISLLKSLGESTILSIMFEVIEDESKDRCIRQRVAEFIGQVADTERSAERLGSLLKTTDIADDVFRALWAVDRRVRGQNPQTSVYS